MPETSGALTGIETASKSLTYGTELLKKYDIKENLQLGSQNILDLAQRFDGPIEQGLAWINDNLGYPLWQFMRLDDPAFLAGYGAIALTLTSIISISYLLSRNRQVEQVEQRRTDLKIMHASTNPKQNKNPDIHYHNAPIETDSIFSRFKKWVKKSK